MTEHEDAKIRTGLRLNYAKRYGYPMRTGGGMGMAGLALLAAWAFIIAGLLGWLPW